MKVLYKRLFNLILFMVMGVNVGAQQNLTLFLMHDLPQANFVNPAVTPECPMVIGVPALSSLHLNYSNTAFAAKDLFRSVNDSLYFNPDAAINNMRGHELIAVETHYTPLYFGMWLKGSYWTFALTEKVYTYNTINQNTAKLFWEGNYPAFTGSSASLSGLRLNVNHYREYAVGWAKQTGERFQMGIRGKLLFGKGNVYTPVTKGGLYTNDRNFALDLNLDSKVNTSFPLEVTTDEEGFVTDIAVQEDIDWLKYMMNNRNLGLGVDFGFIYKLNSRMTLSGSLLDIGFINWTSDVNNFESAGSFQYSGTDSGSDFDNPNYISNITDSLQNMFVPKPTSSGYVSPLVPQMYVGLTRVLTDHINTGAVIRNEFYRNRFRSSLTLSANTYNYKILNGSLSYSVMNGDYFNVGAGIGAKLGVIHIHAISDNLFSFFNLSEARGVNLRFGISIIPSCDPKNKNRMPNKGIQALPCYYNPFTKQKRAW
ncbi:DUF5723 family protein [Carboxylicivirga caseinilyticus]|uniref:DUF5723 family protein n=1 Tax=Carboxylicivirga caseinilyticus TaxID=3417572 RepID=UPI003D3326F8|nr:hypothetical protein [Marinilabiliaceae bacterium A049]